MAGPLGAVPKVTMIVDVTMGWGSWCVRNSLALPASLERKNLVAAATLRLPATGTGLLAGLLIATLPLTEVVPCAATGMACWVVLVTTTSRVVAGLGLGVRPDPKQRRRRPDWRRPAPRPTRGPRVSPHSPRSTWASSL